SCRAPARAFAAGRSWRMSQAAGQTRPHRIHVVLLDSCHPPEPPPRVNARRSNEKPSGLSVIPVTPELSPKGRLWDQSRVACASCPGPTRGNVTSGFSSCPAWCRHRLRSQFLNLSRTLRAQEERELGDILGRSHPAQPALGQRLAAQLLDRLALRRRALLE